jgi:2-polyprenyl-3-methyl-5-hydroxy-6-metoxy-1,4-benzoquinol methylase|tara:strand:- start:206 stop:1213 length:1008 start_codon:yes stop_codon:yes gene_type:complete
MKITKYSKSYNNVLKIKKNFYEDNFSNLNNSLKINKKYSQQPKRKFCKNCSNNIQKPVLLNFKIKYSICNKCGHLNGMYEDSKKFVNWLYSSSEGSNYKKNYSNFFDDRVKNIYIPKVKFLIRVIKKKINLIDIGSGAGHFIRALELLKIQAKGYEPNKSLTNLANSKLRKNILRHVSMEEAYKLVSIDNESNVVSLIGVLEHLNKPIEFIKLFVKSNIKYLYISVPLFSLSVLLENSFSNIYPRQLSGGHTHLYTKESLYYLAKKNNLEIIGEWWFGTDFPDLYRSLLISSKSLNKKLYSELLNKNLFSVINKLQNILDKNKICSEVHIIFKKK